MNNNDIPVWENPLTIEEASKYFRIGENKVKTIGEEIRTLAGS